MKTISLLHQLEWSFQITHNISLRALKIKLERTPPLQRRITIKPPLSLSATHSDSCSDELFLDIQAPICSISGKRQRYRRWRHASKVKDPASINKDRSERAAERNRFFLHLTLHWKLAERERKKLSYLLLSEGLLEKNLRPK